MNDLSRRGSKGVAVREAIKQAKATGEPSFLPDYDLVVLADGQKFSTEEWDQMTEEIMTDGQEKKEVQEEPRKEYGEDPRFEAMQQQISSLSQAVLQIAQNLKAPSPPQDLGQALTAEPPAPPPAAPPPYEVPYGAPPSAERQPHPEWGIRGEPVETILVPFWKPHFAEYCRTLARGMSMQLGRPVSPGEAIYLVIAKAWQQDPMRAVYDRGESGPRGHFNPVIGGWQ